MKLCYVGPLISIHTRRWVRYFADNGHEVDVINTGPAYSEPMNNVRVHNLGLIRSRFLPLDYVLIAIWLIPRLLQYRRLMRRIRPDLVHVHYVNEAALLAVLTGIHPLVITAWGSDVLTVPANSRTIRSIIGFVLRRADLVTCDAEHLKKTLISLSAAPSKIEIVFFGTDTQEFHPDQRDKALREKLTVGDSPTVISMRNLRPIYDVETLIRAVPLVLKSSLDVKFLIMGPGPQAPMLHRLAESLGVSEHMRWLGQIPAEMIASYVASADIYVSTSLSDGGLSGCTAEAMSCALPVIVTDVADNSMWVTEGVSGFLIPPSDPQILASRIINLVDQQLESREQMGQNGRQVIVERNNWHKQMLLMENLYKKFVDQHTMEVRSS